MLLKDQEGIWPQIRISIEENVPRQKPYGTENDPQWIMGHTLVNLYKITENQANDLADQGCPLDVEEPDMADCKGLKSNAYNRIYEKRRIEAGLPEKEKKWKMEKKEVEKRIFTTLLRKHLDELTQGIIPSEIKIPYSDQPLDQLSWDKDRKNVAYYARVILKDLLKKKVIFAE